MTTIDSLTDGAERVDVSVRASHGLGPVVLFAAGGGGHPERYVTLLDTLARAGCHVVAPHLPRLQSAMPSGEELEQRARYLRLSLEACAIPGRAVVGVGHSIGAAILVALAGGQMWLGPGHPVATGRLPQLSRLGLLAPPTGFFRAPGALAAVQVPLLVQVGAGDHITPPEQSRWLVEAVPVVCDAALSVIEGAGHFLCMDQPPPGIVEPGGSPGAVRVNLARELSDFALGKQGAWNDARPPGIR